MSPSDTVITEVAAQMSAEAAAAESTALTKALGHTHKIEVGPGVFRRLVSEGYHRELGVRPMRNVVSRRVRNAVAEALISGVLYPGLTRSILTLHGDDRFKLTIPRDVVMPLEVPHFPQAFDAQLRRVGTLKAHLNQQVIGQEAAIDQLSEAIIPGELGLTPKGMPRSMVLICGPTGTGKTQAVISGSQYLYGTDVFARIDMAEYGTESAVPRLLGENRSDPGYLAEQLDKMAAAGGRMILLDEIEKAHPKVTDMFLGMEAARITTATGRTLDLSGNHILVTSNLGARELAETSDAMPERARRRVVEDAAKSHFRPEVLARFSAIVLYKKLAQDAQRKIGQKMLDDELGRQGAALGGFLG